MSLSSLPVDENVGVVLGGSTKATLFRNGMGGGKDVVERDSFLALSWHSILLRSSRILLRSEIQVIPMRIELPTRYVATLAGLEGRFGQAACLMALSWRTDGDSCRLSLIVSSNRCPVWHWSANRMKRRLAAETQD